MYVCVCVCGLGPLLYGLAVAGMMGSGFTVTLAECFVFASLIVAVDPVAVSQKLSSLSSSYLNTHGHFNTYLTYSLARLLIALSRISG